MFYYSLRLIDINNNGNLLSRGPDEQLKTKYILSRYGNILLPDGELVNPCAKYSAFASMCDFPEKKSNFPKWSSVLNCCSECTGVFVLDTEISCEDDANVTFIQFYHYKNISSFYFQKQLLPGHGKTYPSCTNIENSENGKVSTRKSIVLKSCSILDLHSEYYIPAIEKLAVHLPHVYILGVNNFSSKRNDIFVSKHNIFDHKCTRDYAERCQVLSEQVDSRYFSVWKFIYMEGFALDQFFKLKPSTIPMEQFHSHLSC